MQSGTIYAANAWGIGLEEKFLPEYLKEYGYKTHAIGKVSLLFSRQVVLMSLFVYKVSAISLY